MGDDHRCRGGKNCTATTSDGPAVTAKPDTLCPQCVEDIQRRLDALPDLAAILRAFLGGSMKTAFQSKVKATKAPAPPMNVMVADLLDEIREITDRAGGDNVQIHTLIQKPAELFHLWRHGVRQKVYLDGVDRALDLRRIHGRVSSVVGLERVWSRRAAPCPACRLPALGSWSGSSTVECSACEFRMTLDEYSGHCFKESKHA